MKNAQDHQSRVPGSRIEFRERVVIARGRHAAHRVLCILPCVALIMAGMLVFPAFLNAAQQSGTSAQPQEDPNQFVRTVLNNEVKAEDNDTTYWRFQETDHRNGRKEVSDVVDTKYGEVERLIEINGHPIGSVQQASEDQRIASLVSDPDKIKEQEKKRREDGKHEENMLKMLPDAFRYQYDGMDGRLTRLRFSPNPNFHPPNHEAMVFHHMTGTMWLDGGQKRLARIDGRLTSDVLFGYGLLGRLYKGGTFSVSQIDLGSGHWEIEKLVVQMNGKALFFKTIGSHQNQSFTGYKEIPNGTTLKQAAGLLKEPKSAGENARSSAAHPEPEAGKNR